MNDFVINWKINTDDNKYCLFGYNDNSKKMIIDPLKEIDLINKTATSITNIKYSLGEIDSKWYRNQDYYKSTSVHITASLLNNADITVITNPVDKDFDKKIIYLWNYNQSGLSIENWSVKFCRYDNMYCLYGIQSGLFGDKINAYTYPLKTIDLKNNIATSIFGIKYILGSINKKWIDQQKFLLLGFNDCTVMKEENEIISIKALQNNKINVITKNAICNNAFLVNYL